MTNHQYINLIESMENLSAEDPKKYKRKVAMFAALGYSYIWFWLLVSFGLTVGSLIIIFLGHANFGFLKFVILFGAISFYVLKSLWVKFEPPKGLELNRKNSKALFEMIDGLRKEINAPKIHKVLLNQEFNASISQIPRLGLFGFYKNYLMIGLPLLQGTTPEEFKAVLAHELGHLSKSHGRFSSWVYRIRASWYRMMDTFEEKEAWLTVLFDKFFNWFVPRFNAYSFVLARENEYAADQEAARVTSPEIMANSLIRISTFGHLINNDFWREFNLKPFHQKEYEAPYSKLGQFIQENHPIEDLNIIMKKEFMVTTGYNDTHPSLNDRLKSLNVIEVVPEPLNETAASYFLGEKELDYINHFDQEWAELNKDLWEKRYVEGQVLKDELESEPSNYEEALKYLANIRDLYGTDRLIEAYQEMRFEIPEINQDDDIKYDIGSELLEKGNEEAINLFKEILDGHWSMKLKALSAIRYYYLIYGPEEEFQKADDECNKWRYLLEKADEEMSTINLEWEYEPVDDNEVNEYYASEVAKHEYVVRAYLVKRSLDTMPEREVHYLMVDTKEHEAWKRDMKKIRAQLLNEVNFVETTFVGMTGLEPIFKNLAEHVPDSLIYEKPNKKKKKELVKN